MGYNEEKIIPYILDYYEPIARNIFFLDNCSTDASKDIFEARGHTVIPTGINELNDLKNLKVKHECFKGSDADFVIVSDMDEIAYHPDLLGLLKKYKDEGVTFPRVRGYTMVSKIGYPNGKITNVKTGILAKNYAKQIIFNPRIHINWSVGQHVAHSLNATQSEMEDIAILHYKFMDKDEIHKRKQMYAERLSFDNKKFNLGIHYETYDYEETEKWFDSHLKEAIRVI